MSEYIRKTDEARSQVKEAKKALAAAEKQREKNLKQLAKIVKECEDRITKPISQFAGIRLFLDHLEYNGSSYILNENTFANIITSGSVMPDAKGKGKEEDTRKLYIHTVCEDGEFTAEVKPDDETKARQFANEINNGARRSEEAIADAQSNLDRARNELKDAEEDFTAINNAQYALEEKQNALRLAEASGTQEEKAMLAERDRKRKKLIIIAAAAALVLGAIFLFGGKKPEKKPEETPAAAVTPTPAPTPAPMPKPTPTPTPAPTPEPTPTPEPETQKSGIRPEFKESMDAYEAFFEEYVSFMKAFDETDVSMDTMMKYYDFLSKYTEAMDALDAIDESELSEEEDRYYLEVMLRIDQKLLEAID